MVSSCCDASAPSAPSRFAGVCVETAAYAGGGTSRSLSASRSGASLVSSEVRAGVPGVEVYAGG
jgi:hypothetical protein